MTDTPLQRLVLALILTGLYLAAVALATQYIESPDDVALLWPAAGVALAAVARFGPRWAVVVPLAMLIAHATFAPVPVAFVPWSAMADLVGALAAAAWIHRRTPAPGPIAYGIRLMVAGLLMCVVSAAIGVTGMWQSGMLPAAALGDAAMRWTLGNFLGVVAVGPALVLLERRLRHGRAAAIEEGEVSADTQEAQAWNVALAASFLLMAWGASTGSTYALGLTGLPLSVMVWGALRFSPLRTAVAVMLSVLLIGSLAGLGLAGFRMPEATLDAAILLLYLCVFAILPMVLALAVAERRSAARELLRRATTDALTALPNRGAFEALARAALQDPAHPPMALAYIDLDNLKLVNDTASHGAGDALIGAVAHSLQQHLVPGDLLGHYGGDEFVVLLRNCTPAAARERAQVLLRAVEDTQCRFGNEQHGTTASIGLVPFRPEQALYAEVLSQADAACFSAKEQGGDRVVVAGMAAGSALADPASGMRWTVRLRDALQHHDFSLYAQSIVPLHADLPRGAHFELLLRMHERGSDALHTPDRFIPAAERFRLGIRIDREVVRMALAQLDAHAHLFDAITLCSLNLSAGALLDEGFVDFVAERLHRSAFPASRLCFEITETSAMRDPLRAQRVIDDLRGLGCRFALDDFGTGFCSFSQLRALDVDYIKIDGSFVRDMQSSPLAAEVVRSITRIAHLLRKRTIAEHTESDTVRTALTALGVDYAQGFAIDHPQPLESYLAALPAPKPATS
ncbi:putative bifunctional diguanylate cyclase/phosphodiesterase [Vulcaniibacterium gelatinicum]|uniref:putative bifunctional diguanylate cyclase/phosphodiesterase n=1 Tax=Vulcaniibacterium gelatinicum TaxID=2598725 RepID=UPI0015F2AF16|nr:EAL domain-containing protein [Vulcaniibacterium gelatinicum]